MATHGAASAAPPLTVEECVALALDRAPAVSGAAADSAAAAARVRAARAAYWPRFVGQAQYGHSEGYDKVVTNGGVTALGVGVEAPLLDGGQRAAELAGARARMRSAAALEQQRRADVAFAVRSAYHAALAARSEAEIHADTVQRLERYVTLLERQEALGVVPVTDRTRAVLATETARSAERASVAALNASARELSAIVGSEVTPDALVAPPPQPFVPAGEAQIDASPVVADARAAADAAKRDADVVRSEGRSKLIVNADAGWLGVQPGPTFSDHGGGQFLFGFTLPLYDGGALDARIAAAVAAIASAEANVQLVRQALTVSLVHARADAERAEADVAAWSKSLPAAAEAFLLLRARYFGGGGARLLDVLDSLNQAVDTRVALVRALQDAGLARATQAQLLGQSGP